jgi:hypothetical protein
MRRLLLPVCALLAAAACAGSSTGPSSVGTLIDVAGNWTGSFTSANNPSVQVSVSLTQNGSDITGTWQGASIAWAGDVTGKLNGASMSGQLTFSGRTLSDVTCTGTAAFKGTVTVTSISITSSDGVVGGACPAPLPVGLQIDLHR